MPQPEHGLGRLVAPDPRDKRFLLSRPREALTIEYRYWITRGVYDQGNFPHCVSYAWMRYLTTSPVTNQALDFVSFYNECQRVDEWPGEDYDGTSVRAGARLLKEKGYCTSYQWAFDCETVLSHVLAVGPVVLGTNWYRSMGKPNAKGFIELSGPIDGGHAYTVIGVSRPKQAVRIINSWGPNYGENGRAWLSFSDLDRLIKENGEACVAVEKRVVV